MGIRGRRRIHQQSSARSVRRSQRPHTLLEALARDGTIKDFEFRAKKKDESVIWISTNAVLRPLDEEGEACILGMFQDVTERRAIDQRLRSSEARFRAITEQSLFGIAIFQDDRVRYVNQAVLDMNGYSAEEIRDWTRADFRRLVHPDDAAFAAQQARLRQTAEPDALPHYEYRLIAKGGRVRWVQQFARTIEFEGRPATFFTLVDITARKEAELMLADEKERLSVTLSSIADGVISTDTDARVVSLNRAAEEMLGVNEAEAAGQALSSVFRPRHAVSAAVLDDLAQRVLKSGARIEPSGASLLTHRDGTTRMISASAAPIRHGNDKSVGVVIVFRDVSEEQKLHDSLQRAAKLESLGVLAAGIAHDFNNLLSGLYGHIDLARDSRPEEARKHLDLARLAFERAKALTGQLLAFAKGGAPVRSVGSVDEILRECVAFALSGGNVSAVFDVDPDLWFAEFDKHQLAQAIDNIVINAQQAMPSGGTLHVAARNVEVRDGEYAELRPGRYVRLSLRDEGIGMSRAQLARIFDPFFTTKRGGSGLGLTTTYAILKKHDGTVEVDSESNQGSTFHLLLPAVARVEATVRAAKPAMHRGHGTVLVMDDEPAVRRVFSNMLSRFGYEVEATSEGEGALVKLAELAGKSKPLRFVMLDLTVRAGLGGKDIVGKIREAVPNVPVIASSGYSDDPVMARPHEFGFSASLRKPFLAEELSELLTRLSAR